MARYGTNISLRLLLQTSKPFTHKTHSCAIRLVNAVSVLDLNKLWHVKQPTRAHQVILYNNFMGARQHGYCFTVDVDVDEDDYDETLLDSYESQRWLYNRGNVVMKFSKTSDEYGEKILLRIKSYMRVLAPELIYLHRFTAKQYKGQLIMRLSTDLIHYNHISCYLNQPMGFITREAYGYFSRASQIVIGLLQYESMLSQLLK